MKSNNKEYPNLGWLYYRDYYNGLKKCHLQEETPPPDNTKGGFFDKKNQDLIESGYRNSEVRKDFPEDTEVWPGYVYKSFLLETVYPGLATGTGVIHETGLKGELKLGFQFDYTTGLPYLPGSSVKGLLRSMFPNSSSEKDPEKLRLYQTERKDYLQTILSHVLSSYTTSEINTKLTRLEESIFCHGDIFLDAFIERIGKDGLLGFDYITPHKNAFKNPVPVQFIKVMPGVTFRFGFIVRAEPELKLSIINKMSLFQTILSDIGIGAKTNVGYGQLKKICENQEFD